MNTTYWINSILNTVYAGKVFYVGLSSSSPSTDGSGISEPSTGGYARAQITFSIMDGGFVSNNGNATFPRSKGAWFSGTEKATHWCLFDGFEPSAHLLASGKLAESTTVNANTTVVIPSGEIIISLTDESVS